MNIDMLKYLATNIVAKEEIPESYNENFSSKINWSLVNMRGDENKGQLLFQKVIEGYVMQENKEFEINNEIIEISSYREKFDIILKAIVNYEKEQGSIIIDNNQGKTDAVIVFIGIDQISVDKSKHSNDVNSFSNLQQLEKTIIKYEPNVNERFIDIDFDHFIHSKKIKYVDVNM